MTLNYYSLPDRGLLYLHGEDTRSLLQGIITSDIHKLTADHPLYAALLTPQGKFLFDFFLIQWKDGILLDHLAAQRADLLKKLTMYRLRSKVQFENLSDNLQVIALWGDVGGVNAPYDPRLQQMGKRLVLPKAELADFQKQYPDGRLAGEAEYARHRIALTVPETLKDLIPDKSFPLQSNLEEMQAIDYQKGCYVGQEVTARTKHRGTLRKRIYTVRIEGPAPEAGTAVMRDNHSVGEMLSHAGNLGLAQLDIETAESKVPLQCGGAILYPSLRA